MGGKSKDCRGEVRKKEENLRANDNENLKDRINMGERGKMFGNKNERINIMK